jgi:uncharacterized membrane protein YfcA
VHGADLWLLAGAAFATSVLSAIVGMAGGIVLLAVMLLFLPPLAAIPLHGAIQLASNGSRLALRRSDVRWGILLRFGTLLVPAGALGLVVARRLPPDALRAAIGVFVLLATWTPGLVRLRLAADAELPQRRFVWLGGMVGALNVTIGATGPFMAPFFLGLGLSRQALIGTKAACQTLGHAVKIALFGAVGFSFAEHAPILGAAIPGVVVGTWIGTRVLDGLSERVFTWLYKAVLSAVAVRLVVESLAG